MSRERFLIVSYPPPPSQQTQPQHPFPTYTNNSDPFLHIHIYALFSLLTEKKNMVVFARILNNKELYLW